MSGGYWGSRRLGRVCCRSFFRLLLFLFVACFALAHARADSVTRSQPELPVAKLTAAKQTGLPMLRIIHDLPTPGVVSGVTWSSDGAMVAAYSVGPGGAGIPGIVYVPDPYSNLITVWHADGTLFRKLHRDRPFIDTFETFAFVATNKQIAAPPPIDSNDIALSVFDIAAAEIVHEISSEHPGDRHSNGAKKLVASPDQSILAVAFGDSDPRPLALYSTKTWKKIADLPDGPQDISKRIGQSAFSRDGRFLAVSRGGHVVLIYDLSSRKIVQSIEAFPDTFGANAIAFSPDGAMIAVSSSSGGADSVRVFSIKDASMVDVYAEPIARVESLDWSSDGRFIAFISDYHTLHLWVPLKLKTTESRIDFDHHSDSLAFSPDGRQLAVGVGRNLKIFSVSGPGAKGAHHG